MKKSFVLIFLIFSVSLFTTGAMCKKQAEEEAIKEETQPSVEKTYKIGESFIAGNNLQFKVDKLEKKEVIKNITLCSEAFGDKYEDYIPEKGVYLIVYLTFKGDASNEFGGYDIDAVQLVDSKGNKYTNIEPHGAIDEWRAQSGVSNFSFAIINNPEEKQFMEIFDIPKDAQGLKLQWLTWKDKKIVVEAEVNLGI